MTDAEVIAKAPLLSLCIPTFNRPIRFAKLLNSVANHSVEVLKNIEVCVSDNSSNDETRKICKDFGQILNISYFKNAHNIGGNANILLVPCLARGEYCWILGDDDMLINGSIDRLIQNLSTFSDHAGIIIGYSYEEIANTDKIINSGYTLQPSSPIYREPHEMQVLGDWSATFMYADKAACHTAIVGSVVKRKDWVAYAGVSLARLDSLDLESLDSTFPHSLIWANIFTNKTVLFDPLPYTYFMVGDQEWLSQKWMTIHFSFCLQLSEAFRASSKNPIYADVYVKQLLKGNISQLLINPNLYTKRHFSLRWIIDKFYQYDELWESLRIPPSRTPVELLEYYIKLATALAAVNPKAKLKIIKKVLLFHGAGLANKAIKYFKLSINRFLAANVP